MSNAAPERLPLDPIALLEWINEAADRFESAWGRTPRPALRPFVGDAQGLARVQLLKELVKVDLEHCWRRGLAVRIEDYLADWPELVDADGWLADDLVHFAEQLRRDFAAANPASTISVGGTGMAERPAGPPRTLGKFQLGKVLGRGSFGAVYQARDTAMNRVVAIKVPHPDVINRPELQARFEREARIAGELHHPSILPVHEAGQASGIPYLVTQFIEGESLAERLKRAPLPPRDAAAIVEKLGQGLHYAHGRQVVHRDIKPGNILLDAAGQPYLTDFGLACRSADLTLTLDGQVLGTPAYMAPEQAGGQSSTVGPAADVYALGAVLYELLAGRPPFEGDSVLAVLDQVRTRTPDRPSQLRVGVPADLETICLKCLEKEPALRYPTAEALADDLRRFRHDELILARPPSRWRRLRHWCRRNPVLAGLTGAVFLLLVAIAVIASVFAARGQREALVQKIERIRLTPHSEGWSADAWELVSAAAALGRGDDLRAEAAATLAGIDARRLSAPRSGVAGSLAFDPTGRDLLVGGLRADRQRAAEDVRLWAGETSRPIVPGHGGPGPVGFDSDGTPLEVQLGPGGQLTVRNPTTGAALATCPLAAGDGDDARRAIAHNPVDVPVVALTRDGQRLAAALTANGKGSHVALWDVTSGAALPGVPLAATALAFDPAGGLLAVGDGDGWVRLWSLDDRKVTAELRSARMAIHALAFSPNGRRLAVGGAGGTVVLWDWAAGRSLTLFGASYDVFAVAFSPDGTLLAGAGRSTLLWDATTGRRLLELVPGDYVCALAFAPDGRRLAISSHNDGVQVRALDMGRGVQTLHGLAAPVARLAFGPDGRFVAALSHDWQVGVWSCADQRLHHLFDVPPGMLADNSALAFAPDGRRLAFSSGASARVWDLATGQVLHSWSLPPGLVDTLAFASDERLLLFRMETGSGTAYPDSDHPHPAFPRVGRLRNLLAPEPLKELGRTSFDVGIFCASATPDGRRFIAEGLRADAQGRHQSIEQLDGATGAVGWRLPIAGLVQNAIVTVEPLGECFLRAGLPEGTTTVLAAATGEPVAVVPFVCFSAGPRARQVMHAAPLRVMGQHPGFILRDAADPRPQAILGLDATPTMQPLFNATGDRIAWGNGDGTVMLCELNALRSRLSDVGLGW